MTTSTSPRPEHQRHTRYPVTRGEPYATLPFDTGGDLAGTAVITVTPDTAAEFLRHSAGNRRIKDEFVDLLARELGDGNYSLLARGNAFKFDCDGWFRDGHHTAFAVIKADVTADLGVAWGLTMDEVRQVDTNKDRTLSDVLAVEDYAYPNELAALVKGAIRWDQGVYIDRAHYAPSPEEIHARIKVSHDDFQAAIRQAKTITGKHAGKFVPAALTLFAYKINQISADDAAAFCGNLVSLDDSWIRQNVYEPVERAYEDKLRGLRGTPLTRYGGQLALLCEAWNRYRDGNRTQLRPTWLLGKISDRSKPYFPVPR